MLFDEDFVITASNAFPALTFHIVGSGHPHNARYGPNVEVYDHMPYDRTIRYIKHARIGIAPYRAEHVPPYLADSSMKMMQYDFFGLPTVCPESVTGDYSGRFGYTPGNAASIHAAITQALDAPHRRTRQRRQCPRLHPRSLWRMAPHRHAEQHALPCRHRRTARREGRARPSAV